MAPIMSRIISLLFILIVPVLSGAQHLNFSQFNLTPLAVNPALIGDRNEAKVMLHYRDQQAGTESGFRTYMLSGTYPVAKYLNTSLPFTTVGLSIMDDRSGDAGEFVNSELSLAAAINIPTSKTTYLSFGLNGTRHSSRFNWASLTTGSQYIDGRGFDPGIATGEVTANLQNNYFTYGLGLYWHKATRRYEQNIASFGIALNNLNRPDRSLADLGDQLPVTLTLSGRVRVYEEGPVSLWPEVLYNNYASVDFLNAGAALRYDFGKSSTFSGTDALVELQAKYVMGRSLIIGAQWEQKNFVAGVSYDFAEGRNNASFQGATEVALMLKTSLNNPGVKKIKIKKKKPKKKKPKKKKPKKKKPKKKKPKKKKRKKKGDYTPRRRQPRPAPEKPEAKQAPDPDEQEVQEEPETPATNEPADAPPDDDSPTTGKATAGDISIGMPKVGEWVKLLEFDFDIATTKPGDNEKLDALANLLRQYPNLGVTITGHTDNKGSNDYNEALALKRASAVKAYLVANGIDASRISITGEGERSPRAPNNTIENRARNRRVEFKFYPMQKKN